MREVYFEGIDDKRSFNIKLIDKNLRIDKNFNAGRTEYLHRVNIIGCIMLRCQSGRPRVFRANDEFAWNTRLSAEFVIRLPPRSDEFCKRVQVLGVSMSRCQARCINDASGGKVGRRLIWSRNAQQPRILSARWQTFHGARCICRDLTIPRPVFNGRTCGEFGREADGHYSPGGHGPVAFRIRRWRRRRRCARNPNLVPRSSTCSNTIWPGSGEEGMHLRQVCQRIKVAYSLSFSRDRSEPYAPRGVDRASGPGIASEFVPNSPSPPCKLRARQLYNRRCALIRPCNALGLSRKVTDRIDRLRVTLVIVKEEFFEWQV